MSGPRQCRLIGAILIVAFAVGGCTNMLPKLGGPPVISPVGSFALREAPVKGDAARFAFAPVNGAPIDVLREMSAALNKELASRKLKVVPQGDPTATYVVKGYLSAIGDTSGTSLVYVWDVLDAKGVRLHRISGQVPGRPASTDPWRGIDDGTVKTAAQRTVDGLANWVG